MLRSLPSIFAVTRTILNTFLLDGQTYISTSDIEHPTAASRIDHHGVSYIQCMEGDILINNTVASVY